MSQLQRIAAQSIMVNDKFHERILVVKRDRLFPNGLWRGVKAVDFNWYLATISQHKEFVARGPVETDFQYKQIIPYLVFAHNQELFLMQRRKESSEQRLASKYTLGIGGHLREEDLIGHNFFDWAQREFDEEINYRGTFSMEPLGILNDDSNDVGKAHIGLVLLLKGDSPDISIKSELANGQLVSFNECKAHYAAMETWSQLVFNFLQTHF